MIASLPFFAVVLAVGFFWSEDHKRLTRDRADLITAHASDVMRLEMQLASAERDTEVAEQDARKAEERRQGAFDANVSLSRKRREADDEAFRVAQEFRDHLDSHACLPTLGGLREANKTRGLPAEDYALIASGRGLASVTPIKRGAK